MLFAETTPKGAGIALYGHREDLESLHETIHLLCGGSIEEQEQHEHALSVAYEIRKAFELQRLIQENEAGTVYGTQFVWPYIIFYTSYFRQLADRRAIGKNHQADLLRLEYCLESSLMAYDPKAGSDVVRLYSEVGAVSDAYLVNYIVDLMYTFLFESGSGKIRIRRLPKFVKAMFEQSDDYQDYEKMLAREAKKQGCLPSQLRDAREWPDIEW